MSLQPSDLRSNVNRSQPGDHLPANITSVVQTTPDCLVPVYAHHWSCDHYSIHPLNLAKGWDGEMIIMDVNCELQASNHGKETSSDCGCDQNLSIMELVHIN